MIIVIRSNMNKRSPFNFIYRLFDLAFNIRPDEFWLIQLFLIYLTILSAGYVVTSTSAITLFLSKTSTGKLHQLLPWVYIGNAITIGLVTHFYRKLIDSYTRVRLITLTTIFFMISFLFIRFAIALPGDNTWIYFFFMLWDETCSVVLIMVFYSYLGDYFHVHGAKRVYAYITGGMAVGTPLGGFGSSYFLNYISTPNLLYISTALLALSNLIAYFISIFFTATQLISTEEKNSTPMSLNKIFSNKYLRLVLLIGALAVICSCIDSYQLFYVASQTLNEKEIGNFMGKFYGYMGIALLIVDYILARWILSKFGILGSLSILPILLTLFCLGFIANPILMFAAAIKFIDGTLFQTVNTFALQMLYLPLPERVRVHSQSISIEIMASGARLLAGAILVALSFFIVPIQMYSLIILIVALTWIFCIFLLFPLYRQTMMPHS